MHAESAWMETLPSQTVLNKCTISGGGHLDSFSYLENRLVRNWHLTIEHTNFLFKF